MRITRHLIVNSRGTCRVTKGKAALAFDEIAIALDLVLPDALFSKPQLQAKITVPQDAVKGQEISAEVEDNIKEAIASAAGMPVEITLVRPDDD